MTDMEMLDQVENLLIKVDKPGTEEKTPTMKAFLILARAVYHLLKAKVREKK